MMDFKQRPRSASRVDSNLLLGLMVGFIGGLLVAIVIALIVINTPSPFSDKQKAGEKAAAEAQKERADKAAEKADKAKSEAKAGNDKSRFDFYRILPGKDDTAADRPAREPAKSAAKEPREAPKAVAKDATTPKETYLIQAGSFQNPADADNLKAKLAFIGLEASIEPAAIPDKGTWYRVRLGPYSRLDDINRVRATLSQNGIEASLVKVAPRQ